MSDNKALVRPAYIQEIKEDQESRKERLAFEAFLKTTEGQTAFQLGQGGVGTKRVVVPGHGV